MLALKLAHTLLYFTELAKLVAKTGFVKNTTSNLKCFAVLNAWYEAFFFWTEEVVHTSGLVGLQFLPPSYGFLGNFIYITIQKIKYNND